MRRASDFDASAAAHLQMMTGEIDSCSANLAWAHARADAPARGSGLFHGP
jgi:hypothetical protein